MLAIISDVGDVSSFTPPCGLANMFLIDFVFTLFFFGWAQEGGLSSQLHILPFMVTERPCSRYFAVTIFWLAS